MPNGPAGEELEKQAMTFRMRNIVIGVVLVLVVGTAAVGLMRVVQRNVRPVAVVNGEVISSSDLTTEVNAVLEQQIPLDPTGKEREKQRGELSPIILDAMIEQRLIMQIARTRGAVATGTQVDAQVNEIKANFPSEQAFTDALKQRGLTMTSLRDRLRTNITIRNLTPLVTHITVSDADVEAYFRAHRKEFERPEQVHARHILVPSEVEAKFVLAKFQRGESFEALARQYSQDPGSKEQGGDLGFLSKGTTVPEFEQVAFALHPGETSGVVKSQFGYHIIQVSEHRASQPAELTDAVRTQIRSQLLSKQQETAFASWLKDQKAQAKITRSDRAEK